jgi:hypothetical protein
MHILNNNLYYIKNNQIDRSYNTLYQSIRLGIYFMTLENKINVHISFVVA